METDQIIDIAEKPESALKEEFREYLCKKLKSASRYMSALDNRIREYIRRLVNPDADSIFSYITTEDVEMCIKTLEYSDEFNIANAKSNGLMHAALQQYLQFTIEREKNITEECFQTDPINGTNGSDTICGNVNEHALKINGEALTEYLLEADTSLATLTMDCCQFQQGPKTIKTKKSVSLISYFPRIFRKFKNHSVFSSIFSPAEVKRDSHMLISVFLHLDEETEMAISLAKEADNMATRHGYYPLPCKMKEGDLVVVQLSIIGKTQLFCEKKTISWPGSITHCSFDYYVPNDLNVNELCCCAVLTKNGIHIGEMRFKSQIVEQPMALYSKVDVHPYEKIFISYAHQDKDTVKHYAEAYKLIQRDCFFDRDYLKAGDIFSKEIEKFINSADLFILFWSENAAKSEYVKKELGQALRRAYPQIQPLEKAKLRISPISIAPQAELPDNMKETYHFEIVS